MSHHIDIEFLREAYRRTRKDGATGVDEMTADEYGKRLEQNLASLLERFKSGTYWVCWFGVNVTARVERYATVSAVARWVYGVVPRSVE